MMVRRSSSRAAPGGSPYIGILRYSAGNVGSVQRALARLNVPSCVVERAEELDNIAGLIVPGAGAAGAAMEQLRENGLVVPLQKFRKPFLGLCLGMQLLFDTSEEGSAQCLGIIRGAVRKLPASVVTPHMGWNRLSTGQYAYFAHSYVCVPSDPGVITMTACYDVPFCAGVQQDNFFGVQWHPEKSSDVGDRYLLSFAELCK